MAALGDPLQAARDLHTTIVGAREETEQARRLAPAVVEALRETGLCRLAVPTSVGGLETDPLVALEIFEELASAEASVAWIVWNNALPCFSSALFPDRIQTELFGDRQRLFANSTRPSGTAVMTDDGFSVSGRWSLVSGCELADWIPLMCMVMEGNTPRRLEGGMPDARMMYVPKGSYTIIDTWHVAGLRGTGSHDVVVDNVRVPAERTYSYFDPIQLDRPLYRMPFMATMAAGCAAICLGLAHTARRALQELAATQQKANPGPGLQDRPTVQTLMAASAAELSAARLLLHTTLGEVWNASKEGTPVTSDQCAGLWQSALHTAKVARTNVTAVYEVAGTDAIYEDCPIERIHRDIHVIAQHIILSPMRLEDAGRMSLGLEPKDALFFR